MTPEDWVIEKWFDGLPIHRRGELADDDIHSLKMKIAIALRTAQAEQRRKDAEIALGLGLKKPYAEAMEVIHGIADAILMQKDG